MTTTIKSGPVTEARAREIMDKNFFGMDEAVNHFFVVPTEEQFEFLSTVPFSEETLQECKESHVLAAVFPISIVEMDKIVARRSWSASKPWDKSPYPSRYDYRGEVGWHLVRKEPIANSTSKTWADQNLLLPKDEGVAGFQVMAYIVTGYFLIARERLFKKICVRCADLVTGAYCGDIGAFYITSGLYVHSMREDYLGRTTGLSSARKPDF